MIKVSPPAGGGDLEGGLIFCIAKHLFFDVNLGQPKVSPTGGDLEGAKRINFVSF